MADIEPPSFSLDLDFDPETSNPPTPPACRPLWEEDEQEQLQVMDSEDEDEKPRSIDQLTTAPLVTTSGRAQPSQILKRLRRGGLPIQEPKTTLKTELGSLPSENADDDIEDFSSEDDDFVADLLPSRHYNSVCSSSKASLRGSGVLTPQASAQTISKLKGKAFDSAPASLNLETGHSGLVFPKLTTSPLRRFRLNDSDEEPAPSGNANRKPEKVVSQSTRQFSAATEQSGKSAGTNPRIEDLWKNFRPVQSVPIETPALDAFCNEYFQSVKDKNSANRCGDAAYASSSVANHHHQEELEQCWKANDPLSPARHYFFHDNARIRVLVRNRLPHFFPAGVAKGRVNEQPREHLVDYRSQFGGGGGTSANNGSTRGRKRPKKSEESSQRWVDPKTTASVPKDAGRRRVQASGQAAAAGHWYTSPEGRKVYIAPSGQELTGRTAYRQFKRDSGGYRKSKKKSTSKRKKT